MVFAFVLVNYADKAVIGLSSVAIMHDLGLTNVQFGALGSAFFLLFSISGIAGGFLANRVSTKSLMCVMALIWALALVPLIWVSSFELLFASRVILGAAEGPAFPVALHAIYKWFPDRGRALPTSIVASGAAFGTGVIAPLITWIITHRGWHVAFGVLGVSGLVWAAVWLRFSQEGPIDRIGAAQPVANRRVPYFYLLSSRTAVGVFIAGFGAYWLIALNITWLANYLVKAVHLTPAHAAWIVGLPSVMQMILAPSLALFSASLRNRSVSSRVSRGILAASCVVVAGTALIGMALMPFGFFKVCLIGLSYSIGSVIFTLGSTLIGEISPAAQRGAMLGVTNSVQTLAGLGAPYVMGRMIDVGINPELGFLTGFVQAGLLVVTCGVLAAILIDPESDRRRFRSVAARQERE
jgi:ACS family D-galactonate transporter-like MFS transporter